MARLLLILWLLVSAVSGSAQTPTFTPPALVDLGAGEHGFQSTAIYIESGSWSSASVSYAYGGTIRSCGSTECKFWFLFYGQYARLNYYPSSPNNHEFEYCVDGEWCLTQSVPTNATAVRQSLNISADDVDYHFVTVRRLSGGSIRFDSIEVYPVASGGGGGDTINNYYVTYEPPTPDGATLYDEIDNGSGEFQTVAFRYEVNAGEFFIAALVVFQVAILVITFVLYQKRSAKRG